VFVENASEDGFSFSGPGHRKSHHAKKTLLYSFAEQSNGVVLDEYKRILAVLQETYVWLMGDECYSHSPTTRTSRTRLPARRVRNDRPSLRSVSKNFCR